MSSKKGKLKPDWLTERPESQLVMRFVEVKRDTANREQSSVSVVVATENPVERYAPDRGIVVREVLEMAGLELRGGRDQLPIVDSHDRSTVANVLGSVRRLRIEGDELVGDAYFARDRRSQEAFAKLMDGHLTDFSVTADPLEVGFVERGKTYKTRRGGEVAGPADIVTRWMPTDASLVATGADFRSVVRRSYTDIPREVKRAMDEAILNALVGLGLPEGITDPNAVAAWMVGNLNATSLAAPPALPEEEPPMELAEDPVPEPEEDKDEELENMEDDGEEKKDKAMTTTERAAVAKQERQRIKEIEAICAKAGVERTVADDLITRGVSLAVARKEVLDRMTETRKPLGQGPAGETVRVTEWSADKFYNAVRDGIVLRCYESTGLKRTLEKPAPGAEDFRYMGLRRMGEMFARRLGCNVERMPEKDIALVALGNPSTLNRYHITRDAYHTTGTFANLMLDASNKTLMAGYEEANFTWTIWARQGTSVPDFKNINRVRFSEVPNLEHVPENHDYPEKPMSDSREFYKVEKYGAMFSVTWETVVNDDLDAISRIPAMQGAAARRKQNIAVYSVLTANATMNDTGALFNSTAQTTAGGHANLAGSAGAPSVTTLNAGFLSMRTMKGLTGDAILNIVPAYLIVPVELEASCMQLLGSIADPSNAAASTEDASRPNFNSGTVNIYGPNGRRRNLTLVAEPQLDANSTTAWYLAASTSQVDTVELTFLQGEESPVLENEWDFDKDGYKYKIRQTFGVAPIDFRGLYKNAG